MFTECIKFPCNLDRLQYISKFQENFMISELKKKKIDIAFFVIIYFFYKNLPYLFVFRNTCKSKS